MRVYVRLVHCGELVKCVIWVEHILQVLSTAPAPCPWKVVLSPSVLGAYMVEQGFEPLAARGWFESRRYLFFPQSYPAALWLMECLIFKTMP